jgi:peptidoglycan/xylan/chitin deacetylase (PgdA/CDA1 family)
VLTFDDGPSQFLPDLISILNEENVQGLFFLQSSLALKKEKLCKQILDDGHLVGAHGHTHQMLDTLSYVEQYNEIKGSKFLLKSILGKPIKWFRPTYGLFNDNTVKIAQKAGLELILWRITSWDWMHEKDEHVILDNVLNYISEGDIILLHELPQTIKILPKLIQGIMEKGLKLPPPHSVLELSRKLN